MDFDWSSAPIPQTGPPVALRVVFHVHADPTYDVPKHLPNAREWIALRTFSGMGTLTLSGRPPVDVLPDTLLLFMHKDVRHYACAAEHWDFYWFEFDMAEWTDMPALSVLHGETDDTEAVWCGMCLDALRGGQTCDHRIASALFSVLVARWMRLQNDASGQYPGRVTVRRALQYMELHLDLPFSMVKLASHTGFSERRLRQLFQIDTGMSPKAHHARIRMEKAEAMLISTSFPIEWIADRLGYANAFHFSRHFHQMHGMSPTRFRRNARSS